MKRKFLAIAAIIIASAGIASNAQDNNSSCIKEGTIQPYDGNKMYQPQKFTDFAFEGILLSVDQQAKVDALNAEMKAKKQACKADSTISKADKKACMKNGKSEYVKKVKEILTPDQYTTFLENIVFMPQPDKAKDFKMAKAAKEGKKDFKKCKDMTKDCKKAECKDSKDCKKADCKKADCKDSKECKKAVKDCKKADSKDSKECKKAVKDCKKADCKKDGKDCKKADGKKKASK